MVAGLVCTILPIGLFVHQVVAKESELVDAYEQLKAFTDVLGLVQRNYVEEVDAKQLIEGAIKGMLQSLDPHSGYLGAEMYRELQVETKGEFGGLGIEITVRDGLLTVVAPIEGSPAYEAGVQPGDQIIKIEEEFTKDLTLIDAVKKMRGLRGTPITISVHREGTSGLIPITIVRDIIKVQSVRSRMLDEGFGYVRLSQFQDGSASEFVEAIEGLERSLPDRTLKGLVVDLRNNPGGLLTQAIRVADIFLDKGVVVYTEGRLSSQMQKFYAQDNGDEPSYPIVVLINGGSASASEIVAGALQDHERALILGEQTFGKGSVQTILPMEAGSALRLTTALYFTKSGRSIQAEGIKPDITVSSRRFPRDTEELLEEDEENFGPTKESDLRGAIKNPTGKSDDKASEDSDPIRIGSRRAMTADLDKLLEEDPQLDEAFRLLKTWHVFQRKPSVQAKSGAAQTTS